MDVTADGRTRRVKARLVVGADGRTSQLATLLGFERVRDATELFIGGFRCSGDAGVPVALNFFLHGPSGRGAIVIPTGADHHRVYILHHKDALPRRLSGAGDYAAAFEHFRQIGVPGAWLEKLAPQGVFASFDGAHQWIETPVRDGCVLVGDAAAASDPVWGNGLSRTLRDVRMLRDRLLDEADWQRAASVYAADHDEQFARLRRGERLTAAIFFAMGDAGERRRTRALGLMERHPGLFPDITGAGPTPVSDETVALFLGEPAVQASFS